MTRPRPFLFDTSFDPVEPAPLRAAPTPPGEAGADRHEGGRHEGGRPEGGRHEGGRPEVGPDDFAEAGRCAVEPRFGQADIDAARAAGEAAGRAAAAREADLLRLAVERDAVDRAAAAIAMAAEASLDRNRHAAEQVAQVVLAALRVVLPEFERRHGLAEVQALIAECLRDVADEPRLVVRLHDSLLDPLRGWTEALAARTGFEGRIVFLAQPDFAPTDCRVEWAEGGMERDSRALAAAIETRIARFLATSAPPAEPPSPGTVRNDDGAPGNPSTQ